MPTITSSSFRIIVLDLLLCWEIFSLGLLAAMVRNAGTSIVEADRNQAYELVSHLDALGSDCTLQLCSWHAAEALKA